MDRPVIRAASVAGDFVTVGGVRHYRISNVDRMAPFFMSVISSDDHWLFLSSTGGLTAGRISADHALFPYVTVDRIHESTPHTGCRTLIRVRDGALDSCWEPFKAEPLDASVIERRLYKSVLGDRVCFEELHHELGLVFRYSWQTSAEFGFVRECELINQTDQAIDIEVLDGLQNLLPAGTPLVAQTQSSNLVDAYKWCELDEETGLGLYTLYAGITDRAEPAESLLATAVFCLGLGRPTVLLSSRQVDGFRRGEAISGETITRGIRGAYLVHAPMTLAAGEGRRWLIVADVDRDQHAVVALNGELRDPDGLEGRILATVAKGSIELDRILASADAAQATAEEVVDAHHLANVLFNVLRGGIFADQYQISGPDFAANVGHFNDEVRRRHAAWLGSLPATLSLDELQRRVAAQGDSQLRRIASEYLPITFGRRHGDPSRPWNRFAIRLRDEHGARRLYYEGNWRDIFQNWEALALSYPSFLESIIAKFVNASTMDGYNPYRITRDGIDWEVEEPDDPWSYIGYWGDHQLIYLLKLLEHSRAFHPDRLRELLTDPVFCYANVPYRIRSFDALLRDAKNTVDFDQAVATEIDRRVEALGADGKLVFDADGGIYQVNLLEKLLVPLLAKLGNLVVEGGIWLNTQRPEWNDANNALVGHGLSMVTLCYMRRYLRFLQDLLADVPDSFDLSTEVAGWLGRTAETLANLRARMRMGELSAADRYAVLASLGRGADRYRSQVYARLGFSGTVEQATGVVHQLLDDALAAVDHSIAANRREDGLYHAYNLLRVGESTAEVDHLYPMLEGQVAVLSAGSLGPGEAISVIEALFASAIYRDDQQSFMLYPDRHLPRFLERNRLSEPTVRTVPLLSALLDADDRRILGRDADGVIRFNPAFRNASDLEAALAAVIEDGPAGAAEDQAAVLELYETIFQHRAFTGRSGTMFGFEGLGCIYWHMVSKLLLAVQENVFLARAEDPQGAGWRRLGQLYYQVREGLGFNKTPESYGAFPTDPYSHTPGHSGASQPGMTGQVKEEILTRFGELGVRVCAGQICFDPVLLRRREFRNQPGAFRYLDADGDWQSLPLESGTLAFTWCQVPIVYRIGAGAAAKITVEERSGETRVLPGLALGAEDSRSIFERSGRLRRLTIDLGSAPLFGD